MGAAVTSSAGLDSDEPYAVYRSVIYQQALSVLRDPADSEDATQEVLLRMFRFLPRFQRRSPLSAWIHRITYNVCMNLVAQRNRTAAACGPDRNRDDVSPETLVEDRQTRLLVQEALAELPPKYRLPLVLHYLSDLSYEQIARRTDVPINTVKIRIHRAKKLLRSAFERVTPQDASVPVSPVGCSAGSAQRLLDRRRPAAQDAGDAAHQQLRVCQVVGVVAAEGSAGPGLRQHRAQVLRTG